MNVCTVPNVLTAARILLVPAFVCVFQAGYFLWAAGIFVFAGVTDAVDGFLARVLNQRSRLGTVLDPLADKLLLVSSFFCLAAADWVPMWLALAVLARDVLIVGGIGGLYFLGMDMSRGISPTAVSKANTALQILLVSAAFIRHIWEIGLMWTLEVLVPVVAVSTLVSGVQYVWIGFGYLNPSADSPS
ncbi:MAG: CDP-alcohol phosphatidyltransferase family protein [Desulfonatronovibrionaceae bacterium]